ncbi:unnamed protein product [Agarophyton chilense]
MSFKQHQLAFLSILLAITSTALGQAIRGAFIAEVEGRCTGPCRQFIRSALESDPATAGCRATRASVIGDLSFVDVNCPPSSSPSEADLSSSLLSGTSASPVNILLVKQDLVVSTAAASTSLWGVDEADGGVVEQNGNPVRDGLRTCSMSSNNGGGVNVWILDTGCTPTTGGFCQGYHGGSNVCQDNQGHGTHVAGTVNHPTFGVAPSAVRSCVKVLSDSGSGSYSDVIRGIEFAANNRGVYPNGDVINLSLAGPRYEPVNDAVVAARPLGIYFAIAAGNDARNACDFSPASAPGGGFAFTVQAHDVQLNAASFTNFATQGSVCTDLSAPGVSILSEGLSGSSRTRDGTSMAAPHVAGACAILLSDGLTPTRARLTANSERISINGALNRDTLGLACV